MIISGQCGSLLRWPDYFIFSQLSDFFARRFYLSMVLLRVAPRPFSVL